MDTLLTLPDSAAAPLSIRAKALVFHDPASRELLLQVERLARTDATVLVTGETGTGKEIVARHIHAHSGRSGPFVAVNCGAFSETLIDAELFGHEAGAFTGASQARAGWFESANGGTLFLDEIGDLPLALQVKLLRVLQERQVTRLGSRRSVRLDVRLVAGTNVDLVKAVEAGRFRADLYYRLSVGCLALPPLRERRGDILPLARHFIGVYSARLGLGRVTLSEAAELALLGYAWPGNIRELENVIHYGLILCHDNVVRPQDLRLVPVWLPGAVEAAAPAALPGTGIDAGQAAGGSPAAARTGVGVGVGIEIDKASPRTRLLAAWQAVLAEGAPLRLDDIEGAFIRAAFEHGSRNQVRTARLLGLTRNTLRTLLKRHGLLAPTAAGEALAETLDEEVRDAEAQMEGAGEGDRPHGDQPAAGIAPAWTADADAPQARAA